ncbi:ABC transporter substrate-binding protein [uncultured Flavobacterium sp.]|uniref:ABC transporter substrate-binding protein n=1 Tax=uncultured Flavobacterium sp. TaxID=165435 RepID=UPI0030CA2C77|tara:strand:- start:302 stop:1438 length:1137 start_codon:yes stop_codon:yes gene_type:complete
MTLFQKAFIFSVFLFGLTQCKKTEHLTKAVVNENEIQYAEGFSLVEYDDFSILKVKNTYPDSNETFTYILHKNSSIIPDSLRHFIPIEIPIQKIIVTSTTHIPSLEMLGVENTLIAFPSLKYISSETTRERIDQGKVREIGKKQYLNTEVILDLNPDIIIGYSVDGDLKTYSNLEKNGQKIIYNSDWTEKTPLGKAEWIKFFGALYDKKEKANTEFETIAKSYNKALELVKKTDLKPSVFAGAIYKDQWYLPQGESWAALFFKEANGNYLWSDTQGTGSLSLSFESVLDKAKDADFWIGPGQFTSIDEILKDNPNYKYFKAVETKNVYSFSSKKGKTGGVIYYELAPNRPDLVLKDIIKILHPELLPNYELFFFEQLQ